MVARRFFAVRLGPDGLHGLFRFHDNPRAYVVVPRTKRVEHPDRRIDGMGRRSQHFFDLIDISRHSRSLASAAASHIDAYQPSIGSEITPPPFAAPPLDAGEPAARGIESHDNAKPHAVDRRQAKPITGGFVR